jgi:hypothetical protein
VLRTTGSGGGTRTPDMVVNSHPLYRLSYAGMTTKACMDARVGVGVSRVEGGICGRRGDGKDRGTGEAGGAGDR